MTAECIRSIQAMDSRDYEILVVDNGSRDGSVEYLRRELPSITVLPQERNLGFAAGCNVGIRHAMERGTEYVLLLNNDTAVAKDFLTALIAEAERHPNAAIISPKIYFYDRPERLWWAGGTFRPQDLFCAIPKHVGLGEEDGPTYSIPMQIDWATGCAMLIRCKVLASVALLDEGFFGHAEDLDFSLRVTEAGYTILFAPSARLWHMEGVDYKKNSSQHNRCFLGSRNLLWVMRRHLAPSVWPIFLPSFFLRYILPIAARSLAKGDFRSAGALLRGVAAALGGGYARSALSPK